MNLPSPAQLKSEYPLKSPAFILEARKSAAAILKRTDPRLAAIIGPCSIHDSVSALEYAGKLKTLSSEIDHRFFPIMRVFVEKPRTKIGWKGLLYDPSLDGSHDIVLGLRKSREIMLKIIELGLPIAAELLDPMAVPYFDDLIVWGLIGARTSSSQPHRQMASALSFPVGFKNDCQGRLDEAIAAIHSSRIAHSHIGINADGKVIAVNSTGNPLSHLVLRGSDNHPNYDPASIGQATKLLRNHHLETSLLIDCSHGNCGKDHRRQAAVFESVVEQAMNNRSIAGFMLESHLFEGKQPLGEDPALLNYGVSITDACIGWEETESLLRSTSISSVQN